MNNIGRGRLIPSLPFEAQWNPVIQWLGIRSENAIDKILPNRKSFPDEVLLQEKEVFVEKENIAESCQGEGNVVFCSAKSYATTSLE